uniref:Uncharacterized protein n=1 Tax=viral metagenome TaxID=1070528 RepID=A0A6C0BMV3_9ZZZZ
MSNIQEQYNALMSQLNIQSQPRREVSLNSLTRPESQSREFSEPRYNAIQGSLGITSDQRAIQQSMREQGVQQVMDIERSYAYQNM